MCETEIDCRYKGRLNNASRAKQLVGKGRLTVSGGSNPFVCELKSPVSSDPGQLTGQDISCVGLDHPNCPDPNPATAQ